MSLIRYEGQFSTFLNKHGKEVYRPTKIKVPCSHCKKLISEKYLRRHHKKCIVKAVDTLDEKINHLGLSQTLIATFLQKDSILKKIEVREIVNRMKTDEISLIVKTDPLIVYYGADYMKKQERPQARIPLYSLFFLFQEAF